MNAGVGEGALAYTPVFMRAGELLAYIAKGPCLRSTGLAGGVGGLTEKGDRARMTEGAGRVLTNLSASEKALTGPLINSCLEGDGGG